MTEKEHSRRLLDRLELPPREYSSELSSELHKTNNYSILSKYSASKHGYFKDELLEDFIDTELKPKFRGRSPLVNRGYAVRMKAVQWAIYRQPSVQCLIILGAGYDMLSLRYTKKFDCQCIELDFPEVVETKKAYLIKKFDIQEADIIQRGGDVYFPKMKLHLICCDIRCPSLALSLFIALQNIPLEERKLVAILNEVCLCYLEPCEVEGILDELIHLFTLHGSTILTYIGYEPVKLSEKDPFGMFMDEHFSSMGFALKHFPTSAELEYMFRNRLKFQYFSSTSMHHMYHRTLLKWREDTHFDRQEPFDEFEEMDLFLSHYSLVVAAIDLQKKESNVIMNSPNSSNYETRIQISSQNTVRQSQERISSQMNKYVVRFGHASCLLDGKPGSQSILVNGGFGIGLPHDGSLEEGQHKRLADWFIIHRRQNGWQPQLLKPTLHEGYQPPKQFTRMHAQVCNLGGPMVMINNGRESPTPKTHPSSNLLAHVDVENSSLEWLSASHDTEVRWRHRSLPLTSSSGIIEVGGLSSFPWGRPGVYRPNVNLILLDRGEITQNFPADWDDQDGGGYGNVFARHSFGMDFKDANTLLVFGGLHSINNGPVSSKFGATTLDLRLFSPCTTEQHVSFLGYSTPYYDNQVHFINDHQFVNMGGISTLTGESNNFIELYDLRKTNQKEPIYKEPIQPLMVDPDEQARRLFPTKQTSVNFKESSEIVTIGGGGNFFTFGTHFNRCALVYSYKDLRCGLVAGGGKLESVKQPTVAGST